MLFNELLNYRFFPAHRGFGLLQVAMASRCNGNLEANDATLKHNGAFLHFLKIFPRQSGYAMKMLRGS